MTAVEFRNVWEMYRIKFVIDGKPAWENFWALKDISFTLQEGESLGIIGENGAGKSTVLKLIAGMIKPDRGEVSVNGKVSGLLELGAGFQPELTGKENVYLSASMFGLSSQETASVYENIAAFADMGKFIHAPVKCYSQGMFVRLAFAIAVHVPAQILLIDDTLAVGDEHFQRKCLRRISEFKERGTSIVFVTHDMHMLKRLCNRALLLKEGRIAKDASVEKSLSLYTQTSGRSQKVATITEGPLTVVFNEGRIFVNWQDRLLTPGQGAHTLLLASGAWLHSAQAHWSLVKESEFTLVATGEFFQIPLRQIWKIELRQDHSLFWSIDLESENGAQVQEGFVSVVTVPDYTHWHTSAEKGEFISFPDDCSGWQRVLETEAPRKCVLLRRPTAEEDFPVLAFEHVKSAGKSYAQILSGDNYAPCRMMRFRIMGAPADDSATSYRHLFFSGILKLGIADPDAYLKEKQEHNFLSCGKLGIAFEAGGLVISYGGKPLTRATHMSTEINTDCKRYFSALGQWEIKRAESGLLVVRGSWPGLPVAETWEVSIQDEHSFLWTVFLDTEEEIMLERHHAQIMCIPQYGSWFHRYGTGVFPEEFLHYDRDMLQRCLPGGMVGVAGDADVPALSFEFTPGENTFAKIFNSDLYAKARILRIDKVEKEDRLRLSPGRQEAFRIQARLDPFRRSSGLRQNAVLTSGALRWFFEGGKGGLFFDGVALTKGLGLYTSLRSGGRWYDSSSSAFWSIEPRGEKALLVRGTWAELPLSQEWLVEVCGLQELTIRITMQVAEEFTAERLQTCLMLSEKYCRWRAGGKEGDFGNFKAGVDDDWEVLQTLQSAAGAAVTSLASGQLPAVSLRCLAGQRGSFLRIVNSDLYHRGRLLQSSQHEETVFIPGEYPYFSGKVEVSVFDQ